MRERSAAAASIGGCGPSGGHAVRTAIWSIVRFIRRDAGQDLLEYGLLMVLIAITAIAAVATLGNTVNTIFWQSIAQNF
jgi:Flp pilus assembly pilin Flp